MKLGKTVVFFYRQNINYSIMLMVNTMRREYSVNRIAQTSFLIIITSLIISIPFPLAHAGVNTIDRDGDGYYYDPPSGLPADPDDQNPCIPDNNSQACIASKDPIGAIDDVMNDLKNLISSGDFNINSAQAKSLFTKLKNAISYIESDKINVAINNLNAFNNQINAYINSGKILPEDGHDLISQVNSIIDTIK